MPRPLIAVVVGAATFAATLSVSHAMLQGSAAAQSSSSSAEPIAVVHSIGVLQDLLIVRGHNAALQAAEQSFRADRIQPLQAQMTSLEQEFVQAQSTGQDPTMIAQQYQQVQQAMNAALQQLQSELIAQNDASMASVFAEMRDAARAVCDDLGFAYAIAGDDPDASFSDTPGSVASQITTRLVLVRPAGTDITQAVRDRLDLGEPGSVSGAGEGADDEVTGPMPGDEPG